MINFVFHPTNTTLSLPIASDQAPPTWAQLKHALFDKYSHELFLKFGEQFQDPFEFRVRNTFPEEDSAVTSEDLKSTVEVLVKRDLSLLDTKKFRACLGATYFSNREPICFVTGTTLAIEATHITPHQNSIDNGLFLRADWNFLFESGHWTLSPLEQQGVYQIVLGHEMQRNADYRKYHNQALGLFHSADLARKVYQTVKKEHISAQRVLFNAMNKTA